MTAKAREARVARIARRRRVRARVVGTAERPRLAVYRSLDHIYGQLIDDVAGRTLVSASSLEFRAAPKGRSEPGSGARPRRGSDATAGGDRVGAGAELTSPEQVAQLPSHRPNKSQLSAQVGTRLGERATAGGIQQAVFDRGGFKYHGRVKAFADAARAAGLRF